MFETENHYNQTWKKKYETTNKEKIKCNVKKQNQNKKRKFNETSTIEKTSKIYKRLCPNQTKTKNNDTKSQNYSDIKLFPKHTNIFELKFIFHDTDFNRHYFSFIFFHTIFLSPSNNQKNSYIHRDVDTNEIKKKLFLQNHRRINILRFFKFR